jgi:hypothetical protein
MVPAQISENKAISPSAADGEEAGYAAICRANKA